MSKSTSVVLHIPHGAVMLPNNDQWENRFEIRSATSDRIYIVSQNIKRRHWGCSCPGYKIHRKCKHLEAIGLPTHERPFEAKLEQ